MILILIPRLISVVRLLAFYHSGLIVCLSVFLCTSIVALPLRLVKMQVKVCQSPIFEVSAIAELQ